MATQLENLQSSMTWSHFQKRSGASLERQCTCAKYSSEILPAHSMHRSRGRHGLATSAHFIIIRLIRIWFSGKFFPVGLHSQSLPSIWKTDGHISVKILWPQWPDIRWSATRPIQTCLGLQFSILNSIYNTLNQDKQLKTSNSLSPLIPSLPSYSPEVTITSGWFCF